MSDASQEEITADRAHRRAGVEKLDAHSRLAALAPAARLALMAVVSW